MQKLPAFPAGAMFPYSTPQIPADWQVGTVAKPRAFYALLNMPLYIVVYETWWFGRNFTSKHFTGKPSNAIGGTPSTMQGYFAAFFGFIGLRIFQSNVMMWHKWNIAPSDRWRWEPWQWRKAMTPGRWMTGACRVAGAFTLGVTKVVVDHLEIAQRLKLKDKILAQKAIEQKAKSEATAKAAAEQAKHDEEVARKKAEHRAARKAARKAAKAKAVEA